MLRLFTKEYEAKKFVRNNADYKQVKISDGWLGITIPEYYSLRKRIANKLGIETVKKIHKMTYDEICAV